MVYNKGDRVIIIDCTDYDTGKYNYKVGYKGTINEIKVFGRHIPFIMFDDKSCNYTSLGTAVCVEQFKIIDND